MILIWCTIKKCTENAVMSRTWYGLYAKKAGGGLDRGVTISCVELHFL